VSTQKSGTAITRNISLRKGQNSRKRGVCGEGQNPEKFRWTIILLEREVFLNNVGGNGEGFGNIYPNKLVLGQGERDTQDPLFTPI